MNAYSRSCEDAVYQISGDQDVAEAECSGQLDNIAGVCKEKCKPKDELCYANQDVLYDGVPEPFFCMMECGTYQFCVCYKMSGSTRWTCQGEVLSDANGESCYDLIDQENPYILNLCYRVTGPCHKYRTCPINYCALRNITCSPMNQCYKPGTCDPDTGECFYDFRENGVPCNDNDRFTFDRARFMIGGGYRLHVSANLEELVLGCIEAKFCK